MNREIPEFEVLIVGGGVVGTALLYTLCKYTDIKKIGLIEKYPNFGQVNSASTNNSQTLHFGDIETNYTYEKAKSVKEMADMVMKYLDNRELTTNEPRVYSKFSKMVLAVGKEQVKSLEKRFESFSKLFPNLRLIRRDEIALLEPRVVEGRDPDQEIIALVTEDGYTVDFKRLSHSFVGNAKKANPELSIHLDTKLLKIVRKDNYYLIKTNKNDFHARVVVIAAGGHSLLIAKSLGYGKHLSVLSMAGSFYTAPKVLNGKVYTIQVAKLPFAAIHGDPEVHNENITRFGPTAKPIFQLERYNKTTFIEYWKTFGLGIKPVISLLKITFDKVLLSYIFVNFLYDLPYIGRRLFTKQIRMIIPTIRLEEVKYARKIGGTRPQIVNNTTHKLEMGEAKLTGDNIIFNITPSPGASTCLGNAFTDTSKIIEFLGSRYKFRKEEFEKDLM
jgi:malate dehydrogenase (quinone)